jgi:hypothetical protein
MESIDKRESIEVIPARKIAPIQPSAARFVGPLGTGNRDDSCRKLISYFLGLLAEVLPLFLAQVAQEILYPFVLSALPKTP